MSENKQRQVVDQDSPWEDLVISILSVNQYSLEKTYACLSLLRKSGLFSPENLSKWDLEFIVDQLKSAGCDRGPFMTKLFARRLACLGMAVKSHGAEVCKRVLVSKD